MTVFFRNGLIFLLVVLLFPVNVCVSKSGWDADAIISMRDGLPCFSYPRDKEIKKRPYSFDSLSVSNRGSVGGVWWEISMVSTDRKGLLEPNSMATCIKYGVLHPGTKNIEPAKPLLLNTPYEVFMSVSERSEGILYDRKFLSRFCLACDAKGKAIVVDMEWDSNAGGVWKCLKPGESPKRGFWQRLFGR